MKTCIVLVALVALVGAQLPPLTHTCNCGAFITIEGAEYMIHHLPPFDSLTCDDDRECKQSCRKEWVSITNDGDLDYELANGYSVGEELCIGLNNAHGIDNCYREPVYVYSNVCDGPWVWDGETSLEELCCVEGTQADCATMPPPPPPPQ